MTLLEQMMASARRSNAEYRKEGWLPPKNQAFGKKGAAKPGPGQPKKVSDDEIVELMGQGLTNVEIGRRVGLSSSRIGVRIRLMRLEQGSA